MVLDVIQRLPITLAMDRTPLGILAMSGVYNIIWLQVYLHYWDPHSRISVVSRSCQTGCGSWLGLSCCVWVHNIDNRHVRVCVHLYRGNWFANTDLSFCQAQPSPSTAGWGSTIFKPRPSICLSVRPSVRRNSIFWQIYTSLEEEILYVNLI